MDERKKERGKNRRSAIPTIHSLPYRRLKRKSRKTIEERGREGGEEGGN